MNGLDLKVLRKKAGLSQEELGKEVGLSKNTIYNYENSGQIPASKIIIFENFFKKKKSSISEYNEKLTEEEAQDIIQKLYFYEKELMKYENFILWKKTIQAEERNKTLKDILKNRLDTI